MATATAPPKPVNDSPFVVSPSAYAAHQADLARRAKELEEKQPKLRLCLDHKQAARFEAEKPVYRWRVTAKFDYLMPDGLTPVEVDETVKAQNEDDAWSYACDKVQCWPSRRLVKPTFERLKKLTTTEAMADVEESATPDKARIRLGAKRKRSDN